MIDHADTLHWQLLAAKTHGNWTREYRFHETRKWRLDIANIEQKLGIEVEGGVYINGRHTRGMSFESDCCKYAELAIMGWRLIRVTTRQVKQGLALTWIERAIK